MSVSLTMQSSVQSVKIFESQPSPGHDDAPVHPETETGKDIIGKIVDGVKEAVEKATSNDNSEKK